LLIAIPPATARIKRMSTINQMGDIERLLRCRGHERR
jgi:hypothetical protein